MHQMHNVNGLSCVGCSAGMPPKIHTKADQRYRAKRLFVDDTIHNYLLQELINKSIVSFRNRFWLRVAAVGAFWTLLKYSVVVCAVSAVSNVGVINEMKI